MVVAAAAAATVSSAAAAAARAASPAAVVVSVKRETPSQLAAPPPSEELAPYEMVRAAPRWGTLPKDNMVRRTIERGHRLPFKRRSRKTPFAQPVPKRLEAEFVGERVVECTRLLGTRALVPAPHQTERELLAAGHMICPAFMVAKQGSTKKRLVFNQKRLNRELRKKRGKLGDMRMLKHLAKKGYWAASMDVGAMPNGKDGYHVCEIHPADQKYMTVDLGESVARASLSEPDVLAILAQAGVDARGLSESELDAVWAKVPRYVMCAALPFGYQNAPFLFQKIMIEISRDLKENYRELGLDVPPIVIVYLDDWLLLGANQVEMRKAQAVVDKLLAAYGIQRQVTKGVWPPGGVQILEHLGVGVNLQQGVFYVPPKRMTRIRQQARSILTSAARNRGLVDALWLAQFAGLAISCYLAVPEARFRVRPMFDDLVRGGAYSRKFRCSVRMSRETKRMICWWRDLQSNPEVGRAVWRPPVDVPWTCDASTGIGYGGNWGAQPLTGSPVQNVGVPCAGIWSAAQRRDIKAGDLNITGLELKAVRLCLEAFAKLGLVRGRSMLLYEDNTGVVGILKNLCAKAPAMRPDLEAIMELLEAEDAILRVQYVPSALNPSDYFSRMPNKGEWSLEAGLAQDLMHRWGRCTVDRFADALSAQLRRFNAPYPCHGCEAVDAFSVSWIGERSWINAPWRLLPRICSRLVDEPAASATLLVPHWPSQPWWPVLMRVASAYEVVTIPDGAAIPSALARDMGIAPEITRVRGRAGNMALVHVPFRAAPSVMP